jgi:hypothetical protein
MANQGQNVGDYNVPIDASRWNACKKSLTYVAGTTGAVGAQTLFTVTGLVRMRIYARCLTTLTSGGTPAMSIGTALKTAGIIAATDPTTIAANELWNDATSDSSVEPDTAVITNAVSQNVIQTIATATVTAGVMEFYCVWQPLSPDGTVVAA